MSEKHPFELFRRLFPAGSDFAEIQRLIREPRNKEFFWPIMGVIFDQMAEGDHYDQAMARELRDTFHKVELKAVALYCWNDDDQLTWEALSDFLNENQICSARTETNAPSLKKMVSRFAKDHNLPIRKGKRGKRTS